MERILVLGAYSGIGQAVLNILAKRNSKLFLVGRDQEKLRIVEEHLRVVGNSELFYFAMDLNEIESHKELLEKAIKQMNGLDTVFVCYGILPNQRELEQNPDKSIENYYTNALSTIHFVSLAANYFEAMHKGTIAVVTSVAGDRGRKSNYFYGSAKGCVDIFLEGLRHRLFGKNVKVVTIKPGVVDTPMTKDLDKKVFVSQPEEVAKDIVRALESNKDVVYTPWFWKYIMKVIRLMPSKIFYRLDF
ncbi:MAG: SDR family NAD(P)-dependent oxidoreductase [Ignavibacteria bacterium]|nr:SDR family NAD(P)-dependent oxidoreductase [Ignavibacteria bacterium]